MSACPLDPVFDHDEQRIQLVEGAHSSSKFMDITSFYGVLFSTLRVLSLAFLPEEVNNKNQQNDAQASGIGRRNAGIVQSLLLGSISNSRILGVGHAILLPVSLSLLRPVSGARLWLEHDYDKEEDTDAEAENEPARSGVGVEDDSVGEGHVNMSKEGSETGTANET